MPVSPQNYLIDHKSQQYVNQLDESMKNALGSLYTPPNYNNLKSEQLPSLDVIASNVMSSLQKENKYAFLNAPTISTPISKLQRYDDRELGYDVVDPTIEYKYADKQPIYKKLGNGIAKFGVNVLGGIVGGVAGMFSPFTEDGAENTPILRDIATLQKEMGEYLTPNYTSKYEAENPYLSYFNPFEFGSFTNAWAGNLLPSLGFTVGALAQAALVDTALTATGQVAVESILIPKQLKNIFKGITQFSSTLSKGGKELEIFRETILKNSKNLNSTIFKTLDDVASFNEKFNFVKKGVGSFVAANGEGTIEGAINGVEVEQELMKKYSDEFGNFIGEQNDLKRIKETSKAAAQDTKNLNIPLLLISNSLGLGVFNRPTVQAAKALEKTLGKELSIKLNPKNFDEFILSPQKQLKNIFKPLGFIKNNLKEGVIEEGGQFVISDAIKNYYLKSFDEGSIKDSLSFSEEFANSTNNLFTTEEGRMNMFLGFLGGAVQQGIRSKLEKKPTVNQVGQNTINQLNSTPLSTIFNIEQATTDLTLVRDFEQALKNKDVLSAKNIKTEQFFNSIYTAQQSNKFDARIEQFKQMKNLEDDNFSSFFGEDSTDNNRGVINNYFDKLIDKAYEYKKVIDKVEDVYGGFPISKKDSNYQSFNAYKRERSLNLIKSKDFEQRVESLNNKSLEKSPVANIQDLINLSSKEGINTTIDNFNKKINVLLENEKNAENNSSLINSFKTERVFLERQVKELERATKDNYNYEKDFLGTVNDIYNYYNNPSFSNTNNKISFDDSIDMFNDLVDVNKLLELNKQTIEYYKDLTSKGGFNKFSSEYIKNKNLVSESLAKQIGFDENGKIVFNSKKAKEEEVVIPKPKIIEIKDDLEKINNKDKEAVARGLNKFYEEEPESKAAKIASGEIEATEQDVEDAKENLLAEYNKQLEKEKEDEEYFIEDYYRVSQSKVGETLEERKDRTTQSSKKESSHPNEEKPILNIKQNRLFSLFKDTRTNIIKYLNRVFVGDETLSKEQLKELNYEDWNGNLQKILLSTSNTKELEEVISSIIIRNDDNVAKRDTLSYIKAHYYDNGTKMSFQNLFREKGKQTNLVVYVGDKPIGALQSPLLFKRGEEYLQTSEMSEDEYVKITMNPKETYKAYVEQTKKYEANYRQIESLGLNNTTTNEKVKFLFEVTPSYGRMKTINNPKEATKINDLIYKNKGNALISIPLVFNNGQYERGEIEVMNAASLGQQNLEALSEFLNNDIVKRKIKNLDGRFYYVVMLPNGTYDIETSLLRARTESETYDKLDEFVDLVKQAMLEPEGVSEKQINNELKQELYIANRVSSNLERTYLSYKVSNGNLIFNIANRSFKGTENIEVVITKEEMVEIDNIDDFISLTNEKINSTLTKDQKSKLDLVLKIEDFKKIVNPKIAKDSLTVPVAKDVFGNMRLNFIAKAQNNTPQTSTKIVENAKVTTIVQNGETISIEIEGVENTKEENASIKNEEIQPNKELEIKGKIVDLNFTSIIEQLKAKNIIITDC